MKMKKEIEEMTQQLVQTGLDKLRDERGKLVDEFYSLADAHAHKKAWSGIDSIKIKQAPDTVVKGCLVLEGGSFRGCYTSGVLDVLMENGINIETTIGTSAGALNGYNYVAGEIGRAAKINLGYRHDIRYFGPKSALKSHGVVGFNFILGEIEDEIPFNHERLMDDKRRFLVTVTNCETGELKYCEKGVTADFAKAVQASASMPYVSEMVMIDDAPCLDGGCVAKIPYKWALENGYEKILVIRTRVRDYRRKSDNERLMEITEKLYHNYPRLVERLGEQDDQYNSACDELEKLEKEGRVMMICPSGSISVSHMEGDSEKLGALYLLGRCDATIALPEIKKYLGIE